MNFFNSFLETKVGDWLYQRYKIVIFIFIFISLLGIVYLGFSFFWGKIELSKEIRNLNTVENFPSKKIKFSQLERKSHYTIPVSKKEIFKGIVEQKEVEQIKKISYHFVENLKLKGIMGGKLTKAVIEDSEGRTYLVGEGESFKGVKVEKIKESLVILYYKGRNFTLKL